MSKSQTEAKSQKLAETELVINELAIKPENSLEIFTNQAEKLEPILLAIEKEARALVADVSTKKGRDAIRSNAAKVAKAKAAIERAGKKLADEQKKIPKLIDASRKHSRLFLEKLQKDVRKPLSEWEEAEKQRVSALEERLNNITRLAIFDFEPTAAQLATVLKKANDIEIGESWQEFTERATAEKNRVIAELTQLHAKTEKAEAEAAELERLRKEAAEREAREAKERAEREKIEQRLVNLRSIPENSGDLSIQGLKVKIESIRSQKIVIDEWQHKYAEAVDAKERVIEQLKQMLIDAEKAEAEKIAKAQEAARLEAERKAKEAKERAKAEAEAAKLRAEQEKEAAIAKAKAEAEAKEAARLEAERKAKEAELKRAADKKHRAAINNEAIIRLIRAADITEEQAKAVITAIARNEIPHVSIQY